MKINTDVKEEKRDDNKNDEAALNFKENFARESRPCDPQAEDAANRCSKQTELLHGKISAGECEGRGKTDLRKKKAGDTKGQTDLHVPNMMFDLPEPFFPTMKRRSM
jgi:hypothetical protein